MIPNRCGSWPSSTFDPTSRSSAWISSCRTSETPRRMASAGLAGDWPSIDTVPESGWCTPAAIFMSVDLPAPLPPSRPTISPGATSKSTPRSARTPPKDFSTRLSESGIGSGPASDLGSFLQLAQLVPELVQVRFVDHQDAGVEERRHRFAVADVLERLDRLVAELEGPLHDGGGDEAVAHRLEGLLFLVEHHQDRLVLAAGGAHGVGHARAVI